MLLFLAEMERFELSIPFWGIHDFQSCALDQLRDISLYLVRLTTLLIIAALAQKVKRKIKKI